MRYSNQLKQKTKQSGWKFVDDHSGFTEWSDNAVLDYYGNRTIEKYADYQHPADMPIQSNYEQRVPFTNPPQPDVFLDEPSSDRTSDEY